MFNLKIECGFLPDRQQDCVRKEDMPVRHEETLGKERNRQDNTRRQIDSFLLTMAAKGGYGYLSLSNRFLLPPAPGKVRKEISAGGGNRWKG